MPKISEFQIQRAVCIHLREHAHPDVVWWHTPNGGARDVREGVAFKQAGVLPGIPDLLFLHRGRLFGLELKDENGRLSASQIEIAGRLQAQGALWAWANSLAGAKAQLVAWGLVNC